MYEGASLLMQIVVNGNRRALRLLKRHPIRIATVDTRYFRDDEWTVNGLTAEKLTTSQSTTGQSANATKSNSYDYVVYAGIRVWKRVSGGSETEITSGTPVAQVSRSSNGGGIQSATWNCPQTALTSTDAIVVRVYIKVDVDDWVLCEDWITEQLGASQLDSATWTVYYYTVRDTYSTGSSESEVYWTRIYFWWGTSTYNSRIENFSWTPAAVTKTFTDALAIADTFSKLVVKYPLFVDSLLVTDVFDKLVVKYKLFMDALAITDSFSHIAVKLKTFVESLKLWDRWFHAATPPAFGEYQLPNVQDITHGDTSLLAEKPLPESEIAYREIVGATGEEATVTGWLLNAERTAFLAMVHQKRVLLDIWDRPIYALMLKPELTKSDQAEGIWNYRVKFLALDVGFPASSTGAATGPISFGVFKFPNAESHVVSDTSMEVSKPIPGAQLSYRTQVGSLGRRVRISGWMATDLRDAMNTLADGTARTFNDSQQSFSALMLKPQFTLNEATESIINYEVELVEVEA